MTNKYWKLIGFWAIGLILIVSTVIVIRWAVDFVKWSSLDSGWAQAIGSVAALAVAIYISSRQNSHATRLMIKQNSHATRLMLESDTRAVRRHAAAVSAVVARAYIQLLDAARTLDRSALASSDMALPVIASGIEITTSETRKALAAIPLHDLGASDLVEGVLHMIAHLKRLA